MPRLNSFYVQSGVSLEFLNPLHPHLSLTNHQRPGAFDIVSEFLPHLSIILYRVYPTSHKFLRKLFRLACITTVTGTIAETILTMYLFGILWSRWTIAFKLTTPMLHVLFMSAQLWGSWCFYRMYKKQDRIIRMEEGGRDDLEAAGKVEEEPKNRSSRSASREDSRDGSEIELTEQSMT
jgi:hypothetical protein